MAAQACICSSGFGRSVKPSRATPRAIAPELTTRTSMPRLRSAATCSTRPQSRPSATLPSERMMTFVPSLTTMRRIASSLLSVGRGDCRSDAAVDDGSELAQALHELGELIREERLRAVRHCLVRVRVHLHQQAVSASSNTCERECGNEVALADAVRWIAKHRKVRELLEHGDRGDVHGVARVGLEGADAALAKHEVVVAAGEDVFGGEQNLFDGGGDAALEQAGLAHVAELAEQVEVLHVARTDLEAVDIGEHDLDLRDLHNLSDDEQAVFIGSL